MTLAPGTRIGSCEIVEAIGAGGMGAVYRARDLRLNRDVAIKVLLPGVVGDAERLARFEREAQVLASLNHPNIAHIHGLEDTLFFRAQDAMMSVAMSEGGIPAGAPRMLFRHPSTYRFGVGRDGRFLMIENLPESIAPRPITVVLNWFAELQSRQN